MKFFFGLLSLVFLLNGCAESIALIGTSAGGVSSGKIYESSINTAISYGIKNTTGKTPLGHALTYAEEKNPKKRKDPCISFTDKINSDICSITKKQITLTQNKLKKKSLNINSLKESASSLQSTIDEKSKIKYLD